MKDEYAIIAPHADLVLKRSIVRKREFLNVKVASVIDDFVSSLVIVFTFISIFVIFKAKKLHFPSSQHVHFASIVKDFFCSSLLRHVSCHVILVQKFIIFNGMQGKIIDLCEVYYYKKAAALRCRNS